MSNVFDRLSRGPQNTQSPGTEYENWDQMVGAAPPGQSDPNVAQPYPQTNSQSYPAQQQGDPTILNKLLSNRALMMGAAAIGAKILSDRMAKRNRR